MEQLSLEGLPEQGDTLNSDGLESFRFGDEEPVQQSPQIPDNQPQQTPEEPAQPADGADNWQIRAAYFQSQYDKFRTEVEPYVPLIQLVQQNPQVLDVIQKTISQPANAAPELSEPVMPKKPSNYNAHDAIHDPESESFKFREAVSDYQLQMLEYQKHKEQLTDKIVEEIAQREQQRVAQMTMLREANNMLVTKYGFAPDESQRFIQEMATPESITMDNLVGYWKYVNSQKNGGQEKVQQINAKKQIQFPLPAGVGGGGNNAPQPQLDANQAFNQTFFRKKT